MTDAELKLMAAAATIGGLGNTMAMTGHASVTSVTKSFRSGQARTDCGARLLESKWG